jgi:hypothetical protein
MIDPPSSVRLGVEIRGVSADIEVPANDIEVEKADPATLTLAVLSAVSKPPLDTLFAAVKSRSLVPG